MTTHPKVVIQGAAPLATNMGVSALFAAAVAGVHRRCREAAIMVIAGLSARTATSTVPYSDKALGVNESCGLGNEVSDPRTMDTESFVCAMIESYRRRDDSRRILKARIPGLKSTADRQMDDIVEIIRQCAGERRGGGHG